MGVPPTWVRRIVLAPLMIVAAVVMLVLGGTKRLYGAFIGATIYVVVQDIAAKVNPFYWMFVIGGLLMATVMFLEGGLMEVLDIARREVARAPSRRRAKSKRWPRSRQVSRVASWMLAIASISIAAPSGSAAT